MAERHPPPARPPGVPRTTPASPECAGGSGRLMELRVLGCHGGETPKHRTSSFLLDGRVAVDAGAVTSMLDARASRHTLEAVIVSHAHLDHVRDLATLADNRCRRAAPTLVIAGIPETIEVLRTHFFNGLAVAGLLEDPRGPERHDDRVPRSSPRSRRRSPGMTVRRCASTTRSTPWHS